VYHNNTWDVASAALDASPATTRLYVSTAANESQPRFSRDGKWVAFLSDESGRSEVYVRSFPDPTARAQVSAEGAQELVWSKDGRKLYYRTGNSVMSANLEFSPGIRVLRRDTVTTTQFPQALGFAESYDVAGDGRILTLLSNRDDFQLVVSPNWITEFRQKIAASERSARR
jgi:Tol biopolymer transport system component